MWKIALIYVLFTPFDLELCNRLASVHSDFMPLFCHLQSSNESMADEDSEGAQSRADSRAESHTDLHAPEETDINNSPLSLSRQSVSPEQEYDQPWIKGQTSPSPQVPPKLSPAAKIHQFQYKTFTAPHKCSYCTSLLIGVHRQGIFCRGKNLLSCYLTVSLNLSFYRFCRIFSR